MLSPSKITKATHSINTSRAISNGKAKLHISDLGQSHAFIVASTCCALPTCDGAYLLYREIAEELCTRQLSVVQEKVFGSVSQQQVVLEARKRAFETKDLDTDGPVTTIEGRSVWGEGVAGIVIHAIHLKAIEGKPWKIYCQQEPCGRGWSKDGFTHLMLQNLQGLRVDPGCDRLSRAQQIDAIFKTAEKLLEEQGAKYSDVVRTWFYLDKIVDWYDAFNRIRNNFYQKIGIMPADGDTRLRLPASTGIAGRNSQNAAAVLDLYAVVSPPNHPPCHEQLKSVGQMDAFKYGSAFSRGALLRDSDCAYISLSGTAAIDERGKSLFIDDPERQIACTFDKATILTANHGADLSKTAAAIAYFKHASHVDIFWKKAAEYGLGDLPVVCMVADICRKELLFELECIVAVD